MNRRELIQSLISAPVALYLPSLPAENLFLSFAYQGSVRGSITYNRSGGMVRYSIATDVRPKL